MKKKMLWSGPDHTHLLTIFRDLVTKTGIKKGETLIFSGCEGPCYSMATFFSFGIRDLGLDLYFAVDSHVDRLWKLAEIKGLGFIAKKQTDRIKARVIVLMSALVQTSLEKTLIFVENALTEDGVIIGETVSPGLFEDKGWDEKIKFNYLLEFTMRHPAAYEIENE